MVRIYYDSDREWDGERPVGENARGVLFIVQPDSDIGWHIVGNADYYVNRDGRWFGVDINGLFDYLLDTGLVCFGRMVDQEVYSKALQKAFDDKAFGEKTGYLPRRFKEPKI